MPTVELGIFICRFLLRITVTELPLIKCPKTAGNARNPIMKHPCLSWNLFNRYVAYLAAPGNPSLNQDWNQVY